MIAAAVNAALAAWWLYAACYVGRQLTVPLNAADLTVFLLWTGAAIASAVLAARAMEDRP
ncbi:hypothetical protein DP939_02320 [Spongiactinospora rosea]|uniref:Uncharacterized protein n=1 Tax=Spongiactinospora rosea TaxID=2248750 RepID=A0A366M5U3_9ACTN|nr:hypothetical protein [Spongiactinospora rosea]RBQ21566.1 hypothetical protein DP939_02320 [Spongiactinospora rosea]